MNIKERNLGTCILLTIVTCGFYGLYWAYCVAKDAVSVNDPEDKGTLEIVLSILVPFIGLFMAEKKLAAGCEAQGIPHKDNSILYLILGLLCLNIVDLALMQKDLNELAAANA